MFGSCRTNSSAEKRTPRGYEMALLGDHWQVSVHARNGSDNFFNVRYLATTSMLGTGPNPKQIIDAWRTQIEAAYIDLMSAGTSIIDYIIQHLDPATAKPDTDAIHATTFAAIPGDIAGDAMPNLVAGIISLRSSTILRRDRGRFYTFPPG